MTDKYLAVNHMRNCSQGNICMYIYNYMIQYHNFEVLQHVGGKGVCFSCTHKSCTRFGTFLMYNRQEFYRGSGAVECLKYVNFGTLFGCFNKGKSEIF